MNINNINCIIAGIGVVGLAGCATVPKDAGFGDVQKVVAQRDGHFVEWRGHTADDDVVAADLHALLRKELMVEEAVQIALLNNLNLQATYEELGIAQADLVQAGLLKNPTLSLERRFSGQAAEIDVVQDFLDLLVLPLRKKVAAAEFEAVKLRVAQEVLDTAAEVRSAFYTLQGATQMVEMRRTIVESTDAAADAAERLHEAGNTTVLDLRNQQKQAAQARLDLATVEAEVVQLRERLNVLMGVWGSDSNWTIAGRLAEPPAVEARQKGLESQAVSQRLDLGARRQEIEAAARSLGITETFRFIPVITVSGHYEHEIEPRHSIGPAVELGVPLFDQGHAAVARGQALLAQRQQKYAALAIEIRSEVRAAYSRMTAARNRAEYYRREVLPLQQQILEQTQLQYNGMLVSIFQLIQVKQAQIGAGREYIETLRDYWMARSELEKAVGGRLQAGGVEMPATQPTLPPLPGAQEPQPEQHHHHGG